MRKISYGFAFLLVVCLFYFSARYSNEAGKSRVKTKEAALRKLLVVMKAEDWIALGKVASATGFQELKDIENHTEFSHTRLCKSIPNSRELSSMKLWHHWAEDIPSHKVARWEKRPMINAECSVAGFPKQDVGLLFCDGGRGWQLNGIILVVDE